METFDELNYMRMFDKNSGTILNLAVDNKVSIQSKMRLGFLEISNKSLNISQIEWISYCILFQLKLSILALKIHVNSRGFP